MDLIEKLAQHINAIPNLNARMRIGYLNPVPEDFCIFPLAGSRVVREFMDGTKEQELNFEIAMKSSNLQKLNNTLWFVQSELEKLETLASDNNSFMFEWVRITNKPFINQLDEKGISIFLLDIQVKITTRN